MTKTAIRWMGILLMVAGAADCSVLERAGTAPYKNESLGIYFRHPKAWSVSESKGGFVLKISSSAKLTYSSVAEMRDNAVEATDREGDAYIKQLQQGKWDAKQGSSERVDGTYVRTVNASQGDQKQRTWVAAVPHDLKGYLLTYSAPSSEFNTHLKDVEKLVRTVEFVKETDIKWDNLFFTMTSKNFMVYMLVLVSLISVVFLWKDFWVDLWRLIVAPGDVFRDVGRGAVIVYPILVVFVTGVLLTAKVLSYRSTILESADALVTAKANTITMPAIKKATDDPEGQLIMLYDVRRKGLAPYEEALGLIPFWVPLLPLISWFMLGVGMFLGIKIARGQTTFLWVLKGTAFLSIPQFLSAFLSIQGIITGNMVATVFSGIFGLWGLYLTFVAARELGHFRRGEALIALFVALIFQGMAVGGMEYYWISNYAPKFNSGYTPNTSLIRGFQAERLDKPEEQKASRWMV